MSRPTMQGLDVLGALVGVDRLDVGHVPHDVVVEQDAVAAQQVTRLGDHLAGLEGVVHLGQRGDRVGELALLLEPADPQAVQLHRGDLGEHLHQLVLDELEAHQRLAELGALLGVAQRRLVGRDRVAERAPGHGDPGRGEHPRGVLEAARAGEHVAGRYPYPGEGDVGLPARPGPSPCPR